MKKLLRRLNVIAGWVVFAHILAMMAGALILVDVIIVKEIMEWRN